MPDNEVEIKTTRVYIDGSCIYGAQTAMCGYAVFFGDNHPWNWSFTIPAEDGSNNNKAKLRATIKAIQTGMTIMC